MSLLVVNSSSKVAQGIIKHLHKTGKYENIVCADLYPNYWGNQAQINFLHSVDKNASKTKLVDQHISDRQDLEQQVVKATNVLYVNHDYYSNVASKTNLIKTTSQLVKQYKNVKSFVAVNPTEHDHYGEPEAAYTAAQAQREAQEICDSLTNIRTDLTFGPHSTVISQLVKNLQYGRHITFQPSQAKVSPIHTSCIAIAVAKALEGGHAGKSFAAEGGAQVSWQQILNFLEVSTGQHRVANSKIEQIITPLTNNLLSEYLYRDTYRNVVQYINAYSGVNKEGTSPVTELGVKPISVVDYYKDRKIKRVESFEVPDQSEVIIKQAIY